MMVGAQVQNELHGIVKSLLGKATREQMITWLAAVIEGNEERGKMRADLQRAASHGGEAKGDWGPCACV